MRRQLAVVAALVAPLVGCSAPAAPAPAHNRQVARAVPSGPAPQITWTANATFDAPQLPAVARTGELAIVAAVDGDGGRGFPNLRLEVRDRGDRLVEKLVVMESNDFEQLVPDGTNASPALQARIAAANRRLADLHAEHDLVPMHEHHVGDSFGRETPVEGAGLVVTFGDDNVLRVRTRGGGTTLATANGASWLAPSGKRCPQCPPCENPAWLRAFYKAERVNLVVVRITYSGTDTCWEPGDQLHVVSW